jgi:nitroreductase
MAASATTSRVLETRSLPEPRLRSDRSLEEAIAQRESVREFDSQPLRTQEISQLLRAAQGATRSWGARSAPSAGALYPLELHIVTPGGLFHYLPQGHAILLVDNRDLRSPLAHAALDQGAVGCRWWSIR